MTSEQAIETLRRFNRSYTQRVGALDESFLGTGLPLGAARLLFEIGHGPTTASALRDRLDLDSGYLSRLLRRLEERGLAAVGPDPEDRRRRIVRVTPRGAETVDRLEARSQELAAQLVEPLTERQRARLSDALATADLLVRAATVRLSPVDPADPQAQAAMAAYFRELDRRFPTGFDPGDAAEHDLAALRAPAGCFVLAISEGRPVACGGLQTIAPGVAEIKRMWVDDEWRGAGLGSRLLRRLEDEAGALDLPLVRLDTHGALTEAIAMYERAGYIPIERYNENAYAERFFEKRVRPGARRPRP